MTGAQRMSGIALLVYSLAANASANKGHAMIPGNGFVPDQITAVRIAEAILGPIYGQHKIESERPFTAILTGATWKVEGYLPPGVDGGVAEVWINKRDGRILRVSHGK
jgi:hypothetical protein